MTLRGTEGRGTALVTGYKHIPHRDLSAAGGGSDQTLLDSGVLEYDIKTGECAGDRRLKLRKYPVVRRGEEIFVVI